METASSAALLLLDLPSAALVGIDLLAFTATPKFRGIKDVPAGFHFAFVGSSTAFSERHGIWVEISNDTRHSGQPPLVVTKWDPSSESLMLVTDEAEVLRQRANLGAIWREGLAPYRQQTSTSTDTTQQIETSDWPSLTSHITSPLLSRITGNATWHLSSASSSRADLEAIPGITVADINHEETDELYFLPIDLKQTWRAGATGRERTDAAQDRTWALENLISHHCSRETGDRDIIGELQFTFLMILTLNNFSCLEQWKRLLSLLFTCKAAVPQRADLFVSAIATLRLQLQHCKDAEAGLIDLADEGGSLLKSLLVRFRNGIPALSSSAAGNEEVRDVLDELDDLEDYLRTEHDWQFGGAFAKTGVLELEDGEQVRGVATTAFDAEDETGEFAPVIVDLTPEQARLLGVGDEVVLHERLQGASLGGREAGRDGAVDGDVGVEEASSGSEDEDEDDNEDRKMNGNAREEEARAPSSDDSGGEDAEEMDDLGVMDARY